MLTMKDSGIEWMGYIPSEWDYQSIRYVIKEHFSGSWGNDPQGNDNDRKCMRIADFDFDKIQFKEMDDDLYTVRNYSASDIFGKTLKYGDLLIEKSGGGEKTPVGRTVVYRLEYDALFANFMDCVRVDENIINVEYAKYVFFSLYRRGVTNLYFNQTTGLQNLNMTRYFREVKIPIPALKIQREIASFLDNKCNEINSLLKDIHDEIDLLENYKKSIIYEKICHGIRRESELTATTSDVWSEIPSNWEIKDIKYLFEIVKRIAGKEGFDVLSVTQRGLKVKDILSGDGQLADNYSNYQFVYPTDYVMNHMDLLTGWVDLSSMHGVTSPDYRVFRLRDKQNNNLDYYKYVMQCCYMNKIFYSLGQGVSNLGRWRLQTSSFNNFMVPVPPIEEQIEIAKFLNHVVDEINTIIDAKREQLIFLDEYKKSIVYEYVTGKKEVPAV